MRNNVLLSSDISYYVVVDYQHLTASWYVAYAYALVKTNLRPQWLLGSGAQLGSDRKQLFFFVVLVAIRKINRQKPKQENFRSPDSWGLLKISADSDSYDLRWKFGDIENWAEISLVAKILRWLNRLKKMMTFIKNTKFLKTSYLKLLNICEKHFQTISLNFPLDECKIQGKYTVV